MSTKRLLGAALLGLGLVLLVAGCGGSSSATPTPSTGGPQATATPAPTGFDAEWQALIEAARREGEVVTFICCGPGVPVTEFIPQFEREFGIRWTNSTGSSSQQSEKVKAERAAGLYTLDVWTGGLNTANNDLLPNGILTPVKPLLMHPEVLDESLWWGGEHFWADPPDFEYVFGYGGNAQAAEITYNTDLVDPNEITSYYDLLDPKWRGKIVARDPRIAGTSQSTAFFYMNEELGPDFLRRLLTETDMVIVDDARLAADQLAAGRYAFCLFACTQEVRVAREAGLPVQDIWPNPIEEGSRLSAGANNLFAVADSPRSNAQKLWINWWLSKQGQTLFQKTDCSNSLRIDIPKDDVCPGNRIDPNVSYLLFERDPENFQRELDASLEFARQVMAGG